MRDIPAYWVPVVFVAFIILMIVIIVVVISVGKRRRWEAAQKDVADLGANTAARIQYLEQTNERLVRENEGWKGRAKELMLHLEDRDRKLEAARLEIGVAHERARISDDAAQGMKKHADEIRVQAGLSPISVERPYDVVRRSSSNRSTRNDLPLAAARKPRVGQPLPSGGTSGSGGVDVGNHRGSQVHQEKDRDRSK